MKFLKLNLTLLFLIHGIAAFSQNVDLSVHNVTLTTALNTLGKSYQLKFAFDNELTDKFMVSGKFKNIALEQVLSEILKETTLDYKIQTDVILIYPAHGKKNVIEEVVRTICMIKGMVKDIHSGESLPFATVYIPGTNIGTMANSDGFFNLITKSCDSTRISVSYIGYAPAVYKVRPGEDPSVLTVMLNSEPEEIEEIEVKYEAAIFENARKEDPSCTQLNLGRINDMPSFSELDIMAPLQMLPGIDGTTETSTGLEIRKSPSDKNLIIYDGFTIYLVDHFFGAFSALNAKLVKDIKVYKAIADARQGGRTSGIIEITGKSGNMYKPSFDMGADLLAVDASAEIPVVKDKVSFIIAGRRSYTDYYQTPVYIDLFKNIRYDYEQYYKNIPFAFKNQREDPSYLFYDLGSKLTWKPAEKQTVSLSYYKALDNMDFILDKGFPEVKEDMEYGSEGIGIRWGGELTRRWTAEVVTGISNTRSFFDRKSNHLYEIERPRFTIIDTVSKNFYLNSELKDFSGSFNNQIFLNSYNRLEFGYQLNYYESVYLMNTGLIFNGASYADTLRDYTNKSALVTPYAQHVLTGKRWTLKSGIRLGYYSLTEKTYPEVRFSVSYKANDKFIVKSTLGNYFQFTNRISLIDNGEYRSAWVLSDSLTFPVVEGSQLVTGFNYNITRTLNLDMEFYVKQTKGMVIVQGAYSRDENGVNKRYKSYQVNSGIGGVDILLRKSFGRYQAWIAYTLSKSVSQADGVNKDESFPSYNDQIHEFKIYNSFSLAGFNLTLSWIYGSGKPWDEFIFTENYQLSDEYRKNSSRLSPYHRMDAGINYTLKTKGFSVKAGLNVFNVYNNINLKNRFFELKDNPVREVLSGNEPFRIVDVEGLGITSNVYVNVRF